jgi:hypothetical protein
MWSICFQFHSNRNLLSYVAGSSPSVLRYCFLENCARELALCSQAIMPRLEYLGPGIELVTPKWQHSQHKRINHVRIAYLKPLGDTQDWKKFTLSQAATIKRSVVDWSVETCWSRLVTGFHASTMCYSDKMKLSTHQYEDCGNGPGFEHPYCHVKIKRWSNLSWHMRRFTHENSSACSRNLRWLSYFLHFLYKWCLHTFECFGFNN